MAHSFTYRFDELPLLTKDGIQAGLVNGEAEIEFNEGAEWSVAGIWLEGWDNNKRTIVPINAPRGSYEHALYMLIWNELTNGSCRDHIEGEVWKRVDETGMPSRSDYREHNTHHRALQGV